MASKILYFILLTAVVLALFTEEASARRKILKGRKTVTRTYRSESALPAWAYVLFVAFGELIAGGIVYLILRNKILNAPLTGSYAPVSPHA